MQLTNPPTRRPSQGQHWESLTDETAYDCDETDLKGSDLGSDVTSNSCSAPQVTATAASSQPRAQLVVQSDVTGIQCTGENTSDGVNSAEDTGRGSGRSDYPIGRSQQEGSVENHRDLNGASQCPILDSLHDAGALYATPRPVNTSKSRNEFVQGDIDGLQRVARRQRLTLVRI